MSHLPLVDLFHSALEFTKLRPLTDEEREQRLGPQEVDVTICDYNEAAKHELLNRGDNSLDKALEARLTSLAEFRTMRKRMLVNTTSVLKDYQNLNQKMDYPSVSEAINQNGQKLAKGQVLYHGGYWLLDNGDFHITSRPLSMSFSPTKACNNAEWGGKAYDARELHLLVLTVAEPHSHAFSFDLEDGDKGPEKEVVIANGAKLTFKNRVFIKNGSVYKPNKKGEPLKKTVPFYLVEVELS